MTGKKIVAALVTFVVMAVLSVLWHVGLMADFYAEILPSVARAEPDMRLVFLGYLVVAVVMVNVYPVGYKGSPGLGEGLRFGAVIGLLWWLPANIVLAGVYETTLTSGLVDGGWHIVEGAIGGLVVAKMHARGQAAG